MYKKYNLVRKRGSHIRHVGLLPRGLSSQGPLYIQAAVDVQSSEVKLEFSSLADLAAGVLANQVRVVTPTGFGVYL